MDLFRNDLLLWGSIHLRLRIRLLNAFSLVIVCGDYFLGRFKDVVLVQVDEDELCPVTTRRSAS
jgi:hypothetical protein